ncbi:hypothetical protein SRABI106_04567 [Rahnella aquatilis]|nr:hypothetical protein SRABI106_04567 [Rahnella aquatilis]
MPGIGRDFQQTGFCAEPQAVGDFAAVIVNQYQKATTQGGQHFPGVWMAVNAHISAGFHGDGQTLNVIFRRRMHIQILTQSR